VDLATLPLVGVGSVCRRQHSREVEQIIWALAGRGLRLHTFGVLWPIPAPVGVSRDPVAIDKEVALGESDGPLSSW
jgi:hypothetical protein